MIYMFKGCNNLKYVKMPDDIDTTKPTAGMKRAFYACTSLECITKIDTTNATDTSDMFISCNNLTNPTDSEQDDIEDKINQPYINANPCPAPLDLDGDGKEDEELYDGATIFGQTKITKDDDSINIDIDGDGQADIIIPK